MKTKIKICGITNDKDAGWASVLGCDFVGFNFVPESPRKVSPANAGKIAKKLLSFTKAVGVFANAAHKDILAISAKVPLDGVQLHGDESPDFCRELKEAQTERAFFIIKVFRIGEGWDPGVLKEYHEFCDFFLFDTFREGNPGGTGETFNWDVLQGLSNIRPFFLAGGLTPENVTAAVETVHPFAVDVASGVESSPRRKDFEKMKNFVKIVKGF